MAYVSLGKVCAQYELLSVLDYNLKRRVVETMRRKAVPPVTIDALSGIDLEVADGSRLGLVGANGAGKSTLLAIMAGVLPPTSGSVEVHGRVLALLGGAAEGLDQEATGRDNIVSLGVQLGETPAAMRRRIDDVTEFSGLATRIDHPVYSYSTGMQARLRFSILTSLRPDILLLDEGLGTADAEFAHRADERLREFMSSAGIVVLASHGDDLLRSQCDTAVWLDQGAYASRENSTRSWPTTTRRTPSRLAAAIIPSLIGECTSQWEHLSGETRVLFLSASALSSNDGRSHERRRCRRLHLPEPPEWARELNGVHALIDRGDYDSADAALDAFERRWPTAHRLGCVLRAPSSACTLGAPRMRLRDTRALSRRSRLGKAAECT